MTTQVLGVTFRYSHTIGREENSGPGFRGPWSIARGAGDLMYVLNRATDSRPAAKRITMCTVGEDYLGEFGRGMEINGDQEHSAADGSLFWPTAICLDKEGNLYLSDEGLNRVSIFTQNGDWIGKWGMPGNGDGQLNGPSGLAFGNDDNLFLVDSNNSRVQKFTRDGRFLGKWGRQGNSDGEFNLPWGIDVDKKGDVYVADWGNHRIQKFSPAGQLLMKFGAFGDGDGQFNNPSGVAVDRAGIIYVADWGNHRIQVFNREGVFITKLTGDATISRWGKEKLDASPDLWKQREVAQGLEREKPFWGPVAVEVDDQDRIFVADSSRARIQIYRKQTPYFLGLYDGGRL